MAASLTNDSGRDFLIILNEAATRTTTSALMPSTLPYTAGFNRITRYLLAAVPGSARRRRAIVGQAVLSVTAMLADTARELKAGTMAQRSTPEAVEAIIDFVAGAVESSQPPDRNLPPNTRDHPTMPNRPDRACSGRERAAPNAGGVDPPIHP
jgi:hypothetical protein